MEFHRLTRGLPDPEQTWAPDEQPDAEELAELARDEANARPAPAHPAVLLFLICPFLALDRSPDVMPASVLMLAKRERAPQVRIMLAARAAAAVEPTS